MVDGLDDKVTLFRYELSDSFMGEALEGSVESVVYADVPARSTLLSGQKALEAIGVAGKEVWRVLLEYSVDVTTDPVEGEGPLLVRLKTGTTSHVLVPGDVYGVLKARHQRDEFGVPSHTSLIIERR